MPYKSCKHVGVMMESHDAGGVTAEPGLPGALRELWGIDMMGSFFEGLVKLEARNTLKTSFQRCLIDLRDSRVDQSNVLGEISRNRVCQRADGSFATVLVLEGSELSVEHLISLLDRDLERKPVASWSELIGGELVLAEPCIDSVNSLLRRRNERFNL